MEKKIDRAKKSGGFDEEGIIFLKKMAEDQLRQEAKILRYLEKLPICDPKIEQ